MREMLEYFEDWFYELPVKRVIPVLLVGCLVKIL